MYAKWAVLDAISCSNREFTFSISASIFLLIDGNSLIYLKNSFFIRATIARKIEIVQYTDTAYNHDNMLQLTVIVENEIIQPYG